MESVSTDRNLMSANIKSMQLTAVVTRADGTVEDLGTVASYDRDPAKQAKAVSQGIGKITLCQE